MVNRWPLKIAPWEPLGMGDVEQELFPAAIYGVDEVDLHAAIAPRPVLTGIERYSSIFVRAASDVQERYRQLGAVDKFATTAADDPHGWTPKLRLATADWFSRWFYDRKGPTTEPRFRLEPAENLYCTPNGSIRYSRKGQTIFSLILDKQAKLPPQRPVPKTASERGQSQESLRTELRKLLHYRKSNGPLEVRSIVTTPRENYRIEKLEFLSEPGIYIPTWVYVPENVPGPLPTILYSNSDGMEAVGMEFAGPEGTKQEYGLLDTLVQAGNLVVAVDVRGIGQTRPPHPIIDSFNAGNEFSQLFDLETTLEYMAWLMDESLLGMRVQDVMRSVDYVTSRKEADPERLHVIGQGLGGLWCLYAAALDPRIRSLISVQSLLSYRSLTEVDRYLYGADVFLPNVLLHFDLPQVAAAIADRPLVLIEPRDAMKKPVPTDRAERVYRPTRNFYNAAGRGDKFVIESHCKNLDTPEHYLNLLRGFGAA
jgi:pimeloyl-ACP methyl ester carboxylesterase